MTELQPAAGQLPKMDIVATFTVSEEDECRVMCYIGGQTKCTAYYLDPTTFDCQLYLVDSTSHGVMNL